ncbi:MAG: hypothetical protein NC320_05490 [Clostridium sp.]|nr:hypothetical protein [Clostridium sp.]MCM1547354.1 hypothetical protein [Ruminococcus sp.]
MNNKISEFIKGKGARIIVILGLAGMALILFSDIFFGNGKTAQKDDSDDIAASGYESYISECEEKLKNTLEKINGVGKADVMITAVGSGEYVYAQDEKTDSESSRISRDEKYVIIGNSGDKKALVKKIDNPEIMGVVVVCEGGESNIVKEKVYNAVSAAFGIPTQKIFVAGY